MLYILYLAFSTFRNLLAAIFHSLTASHFQPTSPHPHTQTMKHILILGGSYAGISTAHRLLKSSPKSSIKITLVSPNTHFYWSMASCRAAIPGGFADEQVFQPIAPGFEQYPAGQFEFVIGEAESLDVEGKKVVVSGTTGKQVVEYDFLVLATGSSAKGGLPFKGLGSTDVTKDKLHEFQERVKKAGTIVVAGGGVTGCEVAGELAYEYSRDKKIILVSRTLPCRRVHVC